MGDLQIAPPIVSIFPNSGAPAIPNWARQTLLPGKPTSTNISVPGLRQLAGERPSINNKPNKSTLLTNEPVNTNVTASRWKNNMDRRQQPGDIIFVGDPKERRRRTDMETMNLAQVNTVARRLYNTCTQRAVDRYAGMVTEFTPRVEAADPEIKALLARLAKYGEDVFNNKTAREIGHWTEKMLCTVGLSKRLLLERWVRYLGVYTTDSGRGSTYASKQHQTLTVTVSGPTRAQEVRNVWGSVHNGHLLGVILTRRPLEVASTTGRRVYGEFMLKPWHGWTASPSFFERIYFDEAGLVQYAPYIAIGQVVQAPLNVSSQEVMDAVAGLTTDESQIGNMSIETVMINVDGVKRYRDLAP